MHHRQTSFLLSAGDVLGSYEGSPGRSSAKGADACGRVSFGKITENTDPTVYFVVFFFVFTDNPLLFILPQNNPKPVHGVGSKYPDGDGVGRRRSHCLSGGKDRPI